MREDSFFLLLSSTISPPFLFGRNRFYVVSTFPFPFQLEDKGEAKMRD